MCLSVLLLGWDRAHAEMRVKDLGQCYRDLDEKAKRWSNCRTLHKRRIRKKKKKFQPLNQEDAKNVCLHLDSW